MQIVEAMSLNPCCNGIYSMRAAKLYKAKLKVLILVVMEYTQWENQKDSTTR